MNESIDTIEREFAQSQERSEARRNQSGRRSWRDRIIMFLSILLILAIVGAAILVASGAIKL